RGGAPGGLGGTPNGTGPRLELGILLDLPVDVGRGVDQKPRPGRRLQREPVLGAGAHLPRSAPRLGADGAGAGPLRQASARRRAQDAEAHGGGLLGAGFFVLVLFPLLDDGDRVEVVLVGADLGVHLDLDELGLFVAHGKFSCLWGRSGYRPPSPGATLVLLLL